MKIAAPALGSLLMLSCASTPRAAQPIDVPLAAPPQPASELLRHLTAPDAATRAAAAWSLAGIGEVDDVVLQALLAARSDLSAGVREAAAWALGHVTRPGWDRDAITESRPKPRTLTKPTYPPDAYAQKIMGQVDVEILIDEAGRVTHAEIRKSIPALDAAALACVRQWRFEPARHRGKPVPIVATAPVTFRIF